MRIESASVAMNASRKYESSSVTMRRFMITEVTAGSLQGGNLTATGGDTKASGEEGQEQTAGTKENTGMSLRDWQNRFQTKISSVSLRSSASQTYEEIRNQTIRYIYELFFWKQTKQRKLAGYGFGQEQWNGEQPGEYPDG